MGTQTVEGNKLIAEFMGGSTETMDMQASTIGKARVPTGRIYFTNRNPDNMHLCLIDDLKYHSSWDWLMPVVEKIETLHDDLIEIVYISINGRKCDLWNYFDPKDILRNNPTEDGKTNFHNTGKTKIEAVWKTVIQFIQWYNKQSLTPS